MVTGGVAALVRQGQFDVPEPERQALETDIQSQLARLPAAITDAGTYQRAKQSLPVLKQAEGTVLAFFRDMKDAAFKAHRAITTKETAQLKPIKEERNRMAGLIVGWEREQERRRREADLRQQAALQQRLQDTAVEEAAALESAGEPDLAAQVLEQALDAPAPVVVTPSATVAVAGVSVREHWQFVYDGASPNRKWKDLTDAQRKRVLQFLPREYLMPDEAAIGKVVKAMKSGTKIPGLRAFDAGSVAVRG